MKIINLSAEPEWKLRKWLPHGLDADTVIFLPDACPGKSPLPTGTVIQTGQQDWRKFAVSDCGCGMRLLKSDLDPSDLTQDKWELMAAALRKNKGAVGDLGGGNHFLDGLVSLCDGCVYFLIHTGSRDESGRVEEFVGDPAAFDLEFDRVTRWALANRAKVHEELERIFGKMPLVLDLPHNSYEKLPGGGAIIRKGAVRLLAGDLAIIPSHMSGNVGLIRAKDNISETLFSMSHGTGRTMPRSESKNLAGGYDFKALSEKVIMPSGISASSLRTEGPYAYRELTDCLMLIAEYVEPVDTFEVIAYMGHL